MFYHRHRRMILIHPLGSHIPPPWDSESSEPEGSPAADAGNWRPTGSKERLVLGFNFLSPFYSVGLQYTGWCLPRSGWVSLLQPNLETPDRHGPVCDSRSCHAVNRRDHHRDVCGCQHKTGEETESRLPGIEGQESYREGNRQAHRQQCPMLEIWVGTT